MTRIEDVSIYRAMKKEMNEKGLAKKAVVKKRYEAPKLFFLNIKETKGGFFDSPWETPDWLPLLNNQS